MAESWRDRESGPMPHGRSEGADDRMTDWGILARAVHVLAVVVWIGGVWFVTAVLLPAMKGKPPE